MLEAPQYSRPEVWHERTVPSILLSGNHAKVDQWRRKQSILRTRHRRPDLYAQLDLTSKADRKLLRELEEETGYRCDHLEYLMSVNTTIAFCDEALDIFLARDLKKTPSAS